MNISQKIAIVTDVNSGLGAAFENAMIEKDK